MGFIDTSDDESLPVFYNVVHAVGVQCPNLRDDVKLVQYLLIAFYDRALGSSSVYTRPKGNLTVDGQCGPITNNWILKFQLDVNKRHPGTVAADNRADRVRNRDLKGSFTGTIYTLAVLNKFVKQINPEAFFITPQIVPLENSADVPAPSADVMKKPNYDTAIQAVQASSGQIGRVGVI